MARLAVLLATVSVACAPGEMPSPVPSASPDVPHSQLAEDLVAAERRHARVSAAGGVKQKNDHLFNN